MKKQIIAIVCGLACLLGTVGCSSAAGEAKQEKSEAKSEASRTVTKAEDKAEDKAENKTEEKTEDKSTEESKSLVSAATPLDNKKSTETVPLSEDKRYLELCDYIKSNVPEESMSNYLDQLWIYYITAHEKYPDMTNEQYMTILNLRHENNWNAMPFKEAVFLGDAVTDQPLITLNDAKRIVEEASKLPVEKQMKYIIDELYKIHLPETSTNAYMSNSGLLCYHFKLTENETESLELYCYQKGNGIEFDCCWLKYNINDDNGKRISSETLFDNRKSSN